MAEPFDTIDTKIAQYSPYIETHQDSFYSTNGRYLQLKRTHTVAPDGTATTTRAELVRAVRDDLQPTRTANGRK